MSEDAGYGGTIFGLWCFEPSGGSGEFQGADCDFYVFGAGCAGPDIDAGA